MLLNIIIFLLSLVPSILIIVWMTRRKKEDKLYRKTCGKSLGAGFISVLPIIVMSFLLQIFGKLIKSYISDLAYAAIYNFIVLAFAEELVKYLCFRIILKKKKESYSWADVVAFMVIIGTAFGLIEDIPYAIGASPIVMAVRGLTMGHVGYAYIMGRLHGKSIATGKKGYGVLAFVVPWLLHGAYDFSLSAEFTALHDAVLVVPLALALLDIVLLALFVAFFVRIRKKNLTRFLDYIVIGVDVQPDTPTDGVTGRPNVADAAVEEDIAIDAADGTSSNAPAIDDAPQPDSTTVDPYNRDPNDPFNF